MTYVEYDAIPVDVRSILDETYSPQEAAEWWNKPNNLLKHYGVAGSFNDLKPRDHPEAAKQVADAIADGIFPKEVK